VHEVLGINFCLLIPYWPDCDKPVTKSIHFVQQHGVNKQINRKAKAIFSQPKYSPYFL